jgi:trehalose/maltose hydrolase-like predicted phosphorylase
MGWVNNILKVFNFMNMTLDVDGRRVDARGIVHFTQKLDMRHTAFSTEFDVAGKLHVKHTLVALRHLP